MANRTPVQLSGGAGFGLEDKIAARFLLSMLSGESYFGTDHGVPIRLDWQVEESGWFLDDLLVTLEDSSRNTVEVSISVKTAKQITSTKGFEKSFTSAIWSQWIGVGDRPFKPGRNLLCLATANIADSVFKAWNEMLTEAIDTADERFRSRMQGASATKKALYQSLLPDADAFPNSNSEHTVAMIRHVRVLRFDFPTEPSSDAATAVGLCRQVLRDEQTHTATDLWMELTSIAKRHRESGGSMNLSQLIEALQSKNFSLAQHPNYANDWAQIGSFSTSLQHTIRTDIGHSISLTRSEQQQEIRQQIDSQDPLVLVGPSGAGKSAILSQAVNSKTSNVVWTNSALFDFATTTQQRNALRLEHDLSDTLFYSTTTDNVLVVDGLEGFSEQAVRLLSRVIDRLSIGQSDTWRLVASCQAHVWSEVQNILAVECQMQPQVSELRAVTTQDVTDVFSACGFSGFTREPRILSLFTNLKVLDWVVSALRSDPDALRPETASTKAIMEAVWRLWTGRTKDRHQIAQLLRRLVVEQSVSFSTGVPLDQLSESTLMLVAELENRDVLRAEADKVLFTHDLIADWIRLRELYKSAGDASAIHQYADNPVWHTAIRLYGQSLLDGESDASQSWEAQHLSLRDGSAVGDIAADLLLDAVYLHPNAYSILTERKELFLADNTDLFDRITKRFLLVATVSDPRIPDLTDEQDMQLLLQAQMRIPLWYTWSPMLLFLRDNIDTIVARTSGSVAKICLLWLQSTPVLTSDGTPFPLRKQAAEAALALAREVHARKLEGAGYQGSDRVFYEGALAGAMDLPDEVGDLALQLVRRRPIGDALQARVTAHKLKRYQEQRERERQTDAKRRKPPPISGFSSFRGDRLEPWPIGPNDHVDRGFQSVAWKSNNLQGLCVKRPDIATEVILALCVDAPGYQYEDPSPLGKPGIEHWRIEMPDSYFNGPFLPFLRTNSDAALGLVIDLVNFATDRWCDQFTMRREGGIDPPAIVLPLSSSEVQWFGNPDVYRWYRGGAGNGCPVNCALMALEKWLYDEIDSGKDVSLVISTILQRSRSAAFAGLLVAVGKKKPELFSGPLLPLLGAADIYQFDRILVINGDAAGIGFFMWARHGEVAYNAIQAWHVLEHRRQDLQGLAQMAMLTNTNVQTFFTHRLARWSEEGTQHEYLCAQFDHSNYEVITEQNGESGWTFSYPEALEKEVVATLADNQLAMQVMNIPLVCKRLMEEEGALAEDQLEPFVEQLKTFAAGTDPNPDPDIEHRKPTAVVAGICLLVARHREWLAERPGVMSWCASAVQEIYRNPPVPAEFDSPYSITVADWEEFAGKAAVLMLIENPASTLWREIAANAVTAYHYSTTGEVLKTAFRVRHQLGADFYRLVNVAKYWAAIQIIFSRDPNIHKIDRQKRRLVLRFNDKSISDKLLPLPRLAAAGRRLIIRQNLRDYKVFSTEDAELARTRIKERHEAGLNWMVVRHAVGWLPDQLSVYQGADRSRLEKECADVLSYCLDEAPTSDDDNVDRTVPNDIVRWLLEKIACLTMDLNVPAGRALWQPIMDLGTPAHYWVDTFLSHWFLSGARQAKNSNEFLCRWRELIDYTLDCPIWQPQRYQDYQRERIVREVMGIRSGASVVGAIEYKSVIASLVEQFERWGVTWLFESEAANEFAAFLVRPSAAPLLPTGVKSLARHVVSYKDYHWRESGLETNLATVLQRAWKEFNKEILADIELKQSFFELLSVLVQRQNEAAIVLHGEIGTISP